MFRLGTQSARRAGTRGGVVPSSLNRRSFPAVVLSIMEMERGTSAVHISSSKLESILLCGID
jgi:hypothetical protein